MVLVGVPERRFFELIEFLPDGIEKEEVEKWKGYASLGEGRRKRKEVGVIGLIRWVNDQEERKRMMEIIIILLNPNGIKRRNQIGK